MIMVQMENRQADSRVEVPKIEQLKELINDEDYLDGAIQRIALGLSNEILGIHHGGITDEQRGTRGK